ncbi:hypothetical protein KUH32_05610 [Thalassococcus sp. CAU 1522]|uniref:Uncharacterized protein n=1 Tax=Thalassococcus arenae TaxID=2851652 RepID=A0ABS6N5D9_9RHOB|nr:hypothetical protein [Thalassococcus arenae]MBV2359238.1 hypothetical protein [Thalassococcus arenae]
MLSGLNLMNMSLIAVLAVAALSVNASGDLGTASIAVGAPAAVASAP